VDRVALGWIGILSVFVVLLLGIPVALGLALVGFLGYWAIEGWSAALTVMGLIPYGNIALYSLTVIPLFLFMGSLVSHGGLGTDIYRVARYWVGGIPGGLAQATVGGCALFGGISGSAIADVALFSRLAIPEMLKCGYDRKLAYGAVASAGPLAQMIPPSILMVLYALITNQPVGRLLIAGIVPGLITAANFMLLIYIRARLNPAIAPPVKGVSWRERLTALRDAWLVGVLVVIIIGGIYTGVFTPTEAGGMGAFSSLVIGVAMKRLNLKGIFDSIMEAIGATGIIFLIMVGAYIFGTFLAISQIPKEFFEFLNGLDVPRFYILLGILIMYLFMGTFIDMIAAMFLTLPIIFPTIVKLGYDPIWFGVIVVQLCGIAMITPPYGISLFVIKSVIKDAEMSDIIRGISYYLIMYLISLFILVAFPGMVLFLPNMMSK
jgi:tripartite ATP-independent transporter DctM subunit